MQAPGAKRTAGVDVKPPFDSGRRLRAPPAFLEG
jgi:hypothetical protein